MYLFSDWRQSWYVDLQETRAQRQAGALPLAPVRWGGVEVLVVAFLTHDSGFTTEAVISSVYRHVTGFTVLSWGVDGSGV